MGSWEPSSATKTAMFARENSHVCQGKTNPIRPSTRIVPAALFGGVSEATCSTVSAVFVARRAVFVNRRPTAGFLRANTATPVTTGPRSSIHRQIRPVISARGLSGQQGLDGTDDLGRVRFGPGPKPVDHFAIGRDQKLLEVPLNVAGVTVRIDGPG